jgi:hypothetical protein
MAKIVSPCKVACIITIAYYTIQEISYTFHTSEKIDFLKKGIVLFVIYSGLHLTKHDQLVRINGKERMQKSKSETPFGITLHSIDEPI